MKIKKQKKIDIILYDRILFWIIISLMCVGLVMISSATISVGQHFFHDPFFFLKRKIMHIGLALFINLIILYMPINVWKRYSNFILLFIIFLLCLVLLIGNMVNGATRWIFFGAINIQPSEFSKLSLFFYLSYYLERKLKEVRNTFWGFLKPIIIMFIISFLLLLQPDFGTVVVLIITTFSLLFLSGVKFFQFLIMISIGIFFIFILIFIEPYRIQRILTFWNPWNDPFGLGYQLTQSLIAFGRGHLFGQGLGNSIQKLEYLPEAYTDFIFSIIAEELGYFFTMLILCVIFFFTLRGIFIGQEALKLNEKFSGFLACAISICLSVQTLINAGSATGILPTKGLTFPLISYGGSSLLVTSISMFILVRIDYEIRLKKIQAFTL